MNRIVLTFLVMVSTQMQSPARAYEFLNDLGDTCNSALNQMDNRIEHDCANNPQKSKCVEADTFFKDNGGENLMSHCAKAKLANRAKNFELTKSIIFSAAALQCGSLIFMETSVFSTAQAKLACSRAGAIAGAAGIATDLLGVAAINHKAKDFGKIVDGLQTEKIDEKKLKLMGISAGAGGLSYLGRIFANPSQLVNTGITPNTSHYTWNAGSTAPARPAGGDQLITIDPHQMDTRPSLVEAPSGNVTISGNASSSGSVAASKKGLSKFWDKHKQKLGCIICATSFGLMSANSIVSTNKLSKTRDDEIETAESLFEASKGTVNSVQTVFRTGDQKRTAKPSAMAGSSVSADGDCLGPKKSSDAVMACLSKQLPEVAAITNDPALRNEFKRAFRGKDLGDVINQFDPKKNNSVTQYVADAMGVPRDFASKIIENGSRIAPLYPTSSAIPMAYASAAGGAAAINGGTSKSASSIESQLKDTEFEVANENPSPLTEQDRLFRQLDLMGPQEIYENKNISLFVRIAYRYHKNGKDLDPTSKQTVNRVIGSESK